jgi:hypothetical protein
LIIFLEIKEGGDQEEMGKDGWTGSVFVVILGGWSE